MVPLLVLVRVWRLVLIAILCLLLLLVGVKPHRRQLTILMVLFLLHKFFMLTVLTLLTVQAVLTVRGVMVTLQCRRTLLVSSSLPDGPPLLMA